MLFDLRGKRRRVVQVVYATLAALFLVGFVGFGIGSDGVGGFADVFSGESSGGSLSSQYDDQIDNANEQLAKDPKDTAALLKLSKYEFYKAKEGITRTRPRESSASARTPTPSSAMRPTPGRST